MRRNRGELIRLLRAARALLDLSQDELAEKAAVSRSLIARLEKNDETVTLDSIERIQDTLEKMGVVFLPPSEGLLGAVGLKERRVKKPARNAP